MVHQTPEVPRLSADIMLFNEFEMMDFEVTPGITQVKLNLTVIDNDDFKNNAEFVYDNFKEAPSTLRLLLARKTSVHDLAQYLSTALQEYNPTATRIEPQTMAIMLVNNAPDLDAKDRIYELQSACPKKGVLAQRQDVDFADSSKSKRLTDFRVSP